MNRRHTLVFGFLFAAFSATAQAAATPDRIDVAFSPEAGAERLVIQVIDSAKSSVRMAAYSFTSPAVVRSLLAARQRGVDVRIVVDERGNRSAASKSAFNLVVRAGIPTRTTSAWAIHHDKYTVIDGHTTQTGSFNYSQAAARSNSENVLVVWNNEAVAASYSKHWASRWERGVDVKAAY